MKNMQFFNKNFRLITKCRKNGTIVHQIMKRNNFNNSFIVLETFDNISDAIFLINQLYFYSNYKGKVGSSIIKRLINYANSLKFENGNLVIKCIVKIAPDGYTHIRKAFNREKDDKGIEDERVCKELSGKELTVIKTVGDQNNIYYICAYENRELLVPEIIINYKESFYLKKDGKLINKNKCSLKELNYLPITNFTYINNIERKGAK